jgi:hypothetical protein
LRLHIFYLAVSHAGHDVIAISLKVSKL